jgi:hypothetical protein
MASVGAVGINTRAALRQLAASAAMATQLLTPISAGPNLISRAINGIVAPGYRRGSADDAFSPKDRARSASAPCRRVAVRIASARRSPELRAAKSKSYVRQATPPRLRAAGSLLAQPTPPDLVVGRQLHIETPPGRVACHQWRARCNRNQIQTPIAAKLIGSTRPSSSAVAGGTMKVASSSLARFRELVDASSR